MPMPFAPPIILSQNARTELQALVRASSTPQSLSLRARIVLRAAATDPRPICTSAALWAVATIPWASGDGATLPWA